MGRKSTVAPRDQGESLTTEQRINLFLQQGLDNDTIMFSLCRLKANLKAIEDEKTRSQLAEKFQVETPEFDKIFRQRLLEQIRKCKHKYKLDGEEIELFDSLRDDDGTAKSVADIPIVNIPRFSLGIPTLDAVLGTDRVNGQTGLPVGSCTVIGAANGTGKTRLMVEVAAAVGHPRAKINEDGNRGVLFIQNEERLDIFRTRAAAQWTDKHHILVSSSDNLVQQVALVHQHRPLLVIIDSIQDTRQARFSAGIINMLATYKAVAGDRKCSFVLISHLTTDGKLKGGSYIGHKVDIELIADRLINPAEFAIRCGRKNRYGRTGVNAVFMHTDTGIVPVTQENHRAFSMTNHSIVQKAAVPLTKGATVLNRTHNLNDEPAGGLPDDEE